MPTVRRAPPSERSLTATPTRIAGAIARIHRTHARLSAGGILRQVFGSETIVAEILGARVAALSEASAILGAETGASVMVRMLRADMTNMGQLAESAHSLVVWMVAIAEAIEVESVAAAKARVELDAMLVDLEFVAKALLGEDHSRAA